MINSFALSSELAPASNLTFFRKGGSVASLRVPENALQSEHDERPEDEVLCSTIACKSWK